VNVRFARRQKERLIVSLSVESKGSVSRRGPASAAALSPRVVTPVVAILITGKLPT
jgi:hypothetical protein